MLIQNRNRHVCRAAYHLQHPSIEKHPPEYIGMLLSEKIKIKIWPDLKVHQRSKFMEVNQKKAARKEK